MLESDVIALADSVVLDSSVNCPHQGHVLVHHDLVARKVKSKQGETPKVSHVFTPLR